MSFTRRHDRDHDDLPSWGRPSRCPDCKSAGYLDRIDLVDRVMWQHCPVCRTTWCTAESACTPTGAGEHH